LIREPKEITIGDIIRALEGPIAPSECVSEEREFQCEYTEDCVTRMIWERLKNRIDQVLDEMNLGDLCQLAFEKQLKHDTGFMYHI
jgi:Rrf2 family protein